MLSSLAATEMLPSSAAAAAVRIIDSVASRTQAPLAACHRLLDTSVIFSTVEITDFPTFDEQQQYFIEVVPR